MDDALEREIAFALATAREAAALAEELRGTVAERTKADASPVSAADEAVDDLVRARVRDAFPGDAILTEESADDPARLAARRLWIVDPIDGTRSYLDGDPDWAVQIALAVDGRLRLGVVAIPCDGRALIGAPGAGAWIDDGERRPLRARGDAGDVLITSRSARNQELLAEVVAALPEFGLLQVSSVGVKVDRILRGEADCYVHPRPIQEWDIAAPAAVLIAAGGAATDLAGGELRFNTREAHAAGIVFSRRADHDRIVERLASAGVSA